MAPQFPKLLQTALDDTQGGQWGVVFERTIIGPALQDNIVGHVTFNKEEFPVYDSSKLGPDVGSLPTKEKLI